MCVVTAGLIHVSIGMECMIRLSMKKKTVIDGATEIINNPFNDLQMRKVRFNHALTNSVDDE